MKNKKITFKMILFKKSNLSILIQTILIILSKRNSYQAFKKIYKRARMNKICKMKSQTRKNKKSKNWKNKNKVFNLKMKD